MEKLFRFLLAATHIYPGHESFPHSISPFTQFIKLLHQFGSSYFKLQATNSTFGK
jgi:hypothetical protein